MSEIRRPSANIRWQIVFCVDLVNSNGELNATCSILLKEESNIEMSHLTLGTFFGSDLASPLNSVDKMESSFSEGGEFPWTHSLIRAFIPLIILWIVDVAHLLDLNKYKANLIMDI